MCAAQHRAATIFSRMSVNKDKRTMTFCLVLRVLLHRHHEHYWDNCFHVISLFSSFALLLSPGIDDGVEHSSRKNTQRHMIQQKSYKNLNKGLFLAWNKKNSFCAIIDLKDLLSFSMHTSVTSNQNLSKIIFHCTCALAKWNE